MVRNGKDRIGIIIVAGGAGTRMGARLPKQFLPLDGKPILAHTVEKFQRALPDARIVVAIPSADAGFWAEVAEKYGLTGTHTVCEGGATRFGSVKNALESLPECDYVMIHDGVRPLVSEGLIRRGLDAVRTHAAVIPVTDPVDSVREVDADGSRPVDRGCLRLVQTPQVFRCDVLRKAYRAEYSPRFTDDASVVEADGVDVHLFEGDRANIKITTPEDLATAEALMKMANGSEI